MKSVTQTSGSRSEHRYPDARVESDPHDWSANNPNHFFHFFVDERYLTPQRLNLHHVVR
jgi:hypothetical protein